jgi:hypothetical protein
MPAQQQICIQEQQAGVDTHQAHPEKQASGAEDDLGAVLEL